MPVAGTRRDRIANPNPNGTGVWGGYRQDALLYWGSAPLQKMEGVWPLPSP